MNCYGASHIYRREGGGAGGGQFWRDHIVFRQRGQSSPTEYKGGGDGRKLIADYPPMKGRGGEGGS